MKLAILNQPTLDSREVAEMVDKNHKELLRDIRTYEGYLGESNIALTNFFISGTYTSEQNKELPNYQITKKGCEFIAHKLTGQKGALFTAAYINKFHSMEESIKEQPNVLLDETAAKDAETRLKNANSRQARLLMQIAQEVTLPEYRQILHAYAAETLTGHKLLPLPEIGEKTYTAQEVGERLGVSAKKIGRLANQHKLKTSEFGKYFYDKAKHSNKQVETFRYTENVIPIFKNLIKGETNEVS